MKAHICSRELAWFGPGTTGELGLKMCPMATTTQTVGSCYAWLGGNEWAPLASMTYHHRTGALVPLDGGQRVWVGGGHSETGYHLFLGVFFSEDITIDV